MPIYVHIVYIKGAAEGIMRFVWYRVLSPGSPSPRACPGATQ